jgi:hypothetical protein
VATTKTAAKGLIGEIIEEIEMEQRNDENQEEKK